MDELLNVPEQVVMREGASPSCFIEAKFEGIEDFLENSGFFGSVDPDGLTREVPFTGNGQSIVIAEAKELRLRSSKCLLQ